MIDNGKFTTYYRSPGEIEKVLLNPSISFERIATNTHTGDEVHLHRFRNLTLGVNYRLCKVSVTGSLTTFRKGNNYTNLSFPELVETIKTICQKLHKEPHEITVHRLEYSIVIQTPLPPFTYLDYFLTYKQKEFYRQEPPAWSAKPLLSFCCLQQYRIKFYDTGQWNGLPSAKLLKYEITFTRSKKVLEILRKEYPLTLAHLSEEANLQALGSFAIKVYQAIDTEATLSPAMYRNLTTKQRRLLFAGDRPKFWRLERITNRSNYKKDRKEYLALKRQLKAIDENPMIDLEHRISEQVASLFRPETYPSLTQ